MAARIEWRDRAVRDRALYGPMVIVEEGPWGVTENQESVARLIIRYDAGGGEGANRRRDGCRDDESVTREPSGARIGESVTRNPFGVRDDDIRGRDGCWSWNRGVQGRSVVCMG